MVVETTVSKTPAATARSWTYSELIALNNEQRYELYDGELVIMGSPNLRHQEIIARLLMILHSFTREHDYGTVYLSPVDLYIAEDRVLIPDLMFVRRERFAQERIEREDGQCIVAPPDLVVEILSPSTGRNDRIRKPAFYAAFGVGHYWIIDPLQNQLQGLALANGRYFLEAMLDSEDIFEPSLFPGLRIPLAQVFNF
ncbi:MAG TPA: Uma2 family endonuclease [Abditibacteriaceae bacterium]|nr:Uma2 family endonuclease [Abditibacteriaceae bacterium]